MLLRTWLFLTISFAGLLMGSTFGHVLEMPAKQKIDGPFWMRLQQNLYRSFATIGGFVEIGAILTSIVLAILVRDNPLAFHLTLIAAVTLAVGFFVVWLGVTNVVNVQVFKWTADSIPADWTRWRARWEYSHAARFVLHLLAFSLLVIAVMNA